MDLVLDKDDLIKRKEESDNITLQDFKSYVWQAVEVSDIVYFRKKDGSVITLKNRYQVWPN